MKIETAEARVRDLAAATLRDGYGDVEPDEATAMLVVLDELTRLRFTIERYLAAEELDQADPRDLAAALRSTSARKP